MGKYISALLFAVLIAGCDNDPSSKEMAKIIHRGYMVLQDNCQNSFILHHWRGDLYSVVPLHEDAKVSQCPQ